MTLTPRYFMSYGEASFDYAYNGAVKTLPCAGITLDIWRDFCKYCTHDRYKDAMNLIKKYIKEEE